MLETYPVPDPLPDGWILKRSRSRSIGHAYYYNQFTGECRWDLPLYKTKKKAENLEITARNISDSDPETKNIAHQSNGINIRISERNSRDYPINLPLIIAPSEGKNSNESILRSRTNKASTTTTISVVKSILKNRSNCCHVTQNNDLLKRTSNKNIENDSIPSSLVGRKRSLVDVECDTSFSVDVSKPTSVRVLHILKKHCGSRRPSSWRSSDITISKETACSELEELLKILHESSSDPQELRATFEELARTESDCNTAKRGGDVGYFSKKKMQPAFEKASFNLAVGDLSKIIETSSGVHLILRLG